MVHNIKIIETIESQHQFDDETVNKEDIIKLAMKNHKKIKPDDWFYERKFTIVSSTPFN